MYTTGTRRRCSLHSRSPRPERWTHRVRNAPYCAYKQYGGWYTVKAVDVDRDRDKRNWNAIPIIGVLSVIIILM